VSDGGASFGHGGSSKVPSGVSCQQLGVLSHRVIFAMQSKEAQGRDVERVSINMTY
jgi:hypothetical protein